MLHSTCVWDDRKWNVTIEQRDVSHLGRECLAGLPSACLLQHRGVLRGCVGGLQLSVVYGRCHSLTRQTHL